MSRRFRRARQPAGRGPRAASERASLKCGAASSLRPCFASARASARWANSSSGERSTSARNSASASSQRPSRKYAIPRASRIERDAGSRRFACSRETVACAGRPPRRCARPRWKSSYVSLTSRLPPAASERSDTKPAEARPQRELDARAAEQRRAARRARGLRAVRRVARTAEARSRGRIRVHAGVDAELLADQRGAGRRASRSAGRAMPWSRRYSSSSRLLAVARATRVARQVARAPKHRLARARRRDPERPERRATTAKSEAPAALGPAVRPAGCRRCREARARETPSRRSGRRGRAPRRPPRESDANV